MPASLQFFDMEASAQEPSWGAPTPVTLGPNWQPGDIRVWCNFWFFSSYDSNATTWYFGNNGLIPTGFTAFGPNSNYSGTSTVPVTEGYGVISWRRLLPADTDTFVVIPPFIGVSSSYNLNWPGTAVMWAHALFTVRGVDPGTNPTLGALGPFAGQALFAGPLGVGNNGVRSISVPHAGTMAFWVSTAAYVPNPISGQYAPSYIQPGSLGCPNGWTNLVATPNSGATFYEYDSNPASLVIAKSFSGTGSTGTLNIPNGLSSDLNCQGLYAFFTPAPDVSGTTGSAATTTTATASTFATTTTVTGSTGSASTSSSASTCFNATLGYWISDPLVLTGDPVTGSMVRWNAITPLGSTVTVYTSINGGASWDVAANNQPVPRLTEGDTTTPSVLAKIVYTRAQAPSLFPGPTIFPGLTVFPNGSPPKVTSFELDVSTDVSVDEVVPIGHGMIDSVTVTSTAGTTGSGSSTNVAGATSVIGQGGGQTGGGTCLKVHVNDLSYAIKRNVWQQPYTVPSGENYGAAIEAMVLNRLPDQTAFNITTTTRTCPLLLYGAEQGGDPWQDIGELAQAIGFEAFFDATGTFVCRPVPDPRIGDPVWQFNENAVKLVSEATRELSSQQTFNDIVVVGQSTSSQNPFSAEAYDNDPASPTYVLGPYGRVSQRLTFSLITSQDQAQDVANAALYNSLGAADTVTLTVVPMPALEPGDIVKVVCSNVNANGTYMINSMTTPLSPADPQVLTCFRQTTSSGIALSATRSVTDGALTSGSATVTSNTANFQASDVGALILGAGIVANTTISSVTTSTTAVMSTNSTLTATGVILGITVTGSS